MDIKEFERGFIVANRLIEDVQKNYAEAVEDKDWGRASRLDAYIDGMNQILIVFEQAKAGMIKE